ncbi:MAG: hypothetical protein ACOCUU_01585 [Nanoarchaeota archaeon]
MKHIIYFSSSASTSGKALSGDLMKAGRIDIAIHSIIASLFVSHSIRKDVKIHLIFYGPPESPKHIEISFDSGLDISKKDVAGLLKRVLYKSSNMKSEDEKKQVFPGVFVEKKSFLNVISDLQEQGIDIFILDKKGKDIRNLEFSQDNEVGFVIGDQDGLPEKEVKRLVKSGNVKEISLGPKMYFASQSIIILLNEMDRREV